MTDYEWVLAISLAGHDANITLLHHGEIVLFLNEERISRADGKEDARRD